MLQVLDEHRAINKPLDFMGEQGEKSEVTLFNRVILSVVLTEREVVEVLLVRTCILQGVQGSPPEICVGDLCERLLDHTGVQALEWAAQEFQPCCII